MFTIYKAVNLVNGKAYIGYTKTTLTIRIQRHYAQARYAVKYNKPTSHWWRALTQYPPEAFEWQILYQSWDKEYCMNVMEDYFITEYDTYKSGYNSVRGGNAGEGLLKEKNGMFGKTHTVAVKQSLSEQAKARNWVGDKNPMFGKSRPDLAAKNKQPKRWVTKDGADKQVVLAEVEEYLANGFEIGRSGVRGQKKPRLTCECGNTVQSTQSKYCSRQCANYYNGLLRKAY